MFCSDETKGFTVTWKIKNFSKFSKRKQILRSSVWKTETTEGCTLWRFLLDMFNLDLQCALTSLKREMKEEDCKYEMCLLTSSGEVQLRHELCNYACCIFKIEKNKIFGDTSNSFLPQDTLTLRCTIWQPKLKPGRCLFRNTLHEVNFPCIIEGFRSDSDTTYRFLHQEGKMLIGMFLYNINKNTFNVRIELLPDSGRLSSFISCQLSIKDGCGHCGTVLSSNSIHPMVSWEWTIGITPERRNCPVIFTFDNNLHLEFETIIGTEEEHQQLPIPSDAGPSSSNTLSDHFLQLYKKRTLSDVTINTEDKSIPAHRNILATRSPVFYAMFEEDQMIEGQSGVVDIEDIDSETMDRFLLYLYSDLQWNEASALYYAADKYAVLCLKKKCAEILMFGLTADNVCDALTLSDKHSDEQLMSHAVDFVRDHEEILASSAWASLEKSNSLLTTKVLRQVIQKKAKK